MKMNKELTFPAFFITITLCNNGVAMDNITFSNLNKTNFYTSTINDDRITNTKFNTIKTYGENMRFNFSQKEIEKTKILYPTYKDEIHIITISENLIKDLDTEYKDLDMESYDKETQKSFFDSVEQLKYLLTNVSIKKTPDILTFHKGYFGLVWDAKNDDSIYLYSIPKGKLFYDKVGKDRDEVRRINPEKKAFENIIKEINNMV